MYRKERQDEILAVIRRQGYASVSALTESLHYSTATINRDLNELEKQNLIKRSYGGAEPTQPQQIPHMFRYQKMRKSKRKISARASAFVNDGDMIFIDGSTTAEYMAEFLRDRKNLTVVTNNNMLATALHPYGIKVICLGGTILEEPGVTGGDICCQNAAHFLVDKVFFSPSSVSDEGLVSGPSLLFSIIMRNAKEIYLLIDREKINKPFRCTLCDFSMMSTIISDYQFSRQTREKFPHTQFIFTETI